MEKATSQKVEETVIKLCDWIQDKCKNGTSSEELAVLPEVVKATAELHGSLYN